MLSRKHQQEPGINLGSTQPGVGNQIVKNLSESVAYCAGGLAGFRLGPVLGAGASGTVHAATRLCDNLEVAVKCIHVGESSEQVLRTVLREAELLAEVRHPNVVELLEAVQEGERVKLVLERADSGDLTNVINSIRTTEQPVHEDSVMFGFVQVALAVWHLHCKGIIHRDIKPQNILVHEGHFLKLCDFGAAKAERDIDKDQDKMVGTPCYLAPEVLQGQSYTEKSDVWALGCVLYEMVAKRRAYDGPTVFAVLHKVAKGERLPIGDQCSSQMAGLIEDMLHADPMVRPTMRQILMMPFVRHYVGLYADSLKHRHVDASLLHLEELEIYDCEPEGASAAVHGLQRTKAGPLDEGLSGRDTGECLAQPDLRNVSPLQAEGKLGWQPLQLWSHINMQPVADQAVATTSSKVDGCYFSSRQAFNRTTPFAQCMLVSGHDGI